MAALAAVQANSARGTRGYPRAMRGVLIEVPEQMLAATPLRAVRGQKTVEVKLMWADKGEVLNRLTREAPAPDFLLAAGDDATDEDLFARAPAHVLIPRW